MVDPLFLPSRLSSGVPSLEKLQQQSIATALLWTRAAAWQMDVQTQQLTWTPEFAKLFHFDPTVTQASFEEWVRKIHPEDRATVIQSIQAITENTQSKQICEYRIQCAGQNERWVQSIGEFYSETETHRPWILGLAYDITSHKQHEVHLQRTIAFAQRLLDSNQDCLKVLDLQGRLLYMNESGQTLMEIDDFEGKVKHEIWADFWQGCDREAAESAFKTALGGGVGKFDGYCATAKGTPKWWEVVVSPILDTQGNITEILSASHDISSRKLTELALQERNNELDAFARVVSHDLKAPLRKIANLANWIQEDLSGHISDETEHHLDLMEQQVQRMDMLIGGLLQVARVGKHDLQPELVDISELLQEIIESLALPEDFQVTVASPLPKFSTKRVLLHQVLSNLICNAVKHHDRETGTVKISVQQYCGKYEFTITDDGPGILPEDRDRIFDVFCTLDNTPSSSNTGIGLALVKKVVLAEGGKLWIESNQPRGCQFCFTWFPTTTSSSKGQAV